MSVSVPAPGNGNRVMVVHATGLVDGSPGAMTQVPVLAQAGGLTVPALPFANTGVIPMPIRPATAMPRAALPDVIQRDLFVLEDCTFDLHLIPEPPRLRVEGKDPLTHASCEECSNFTGCLTSGVRLTVDTICRHWHTSNREVLNVRQVLRLTIV